MPPTVLFDGACSFCNRTVRWIIRRDPAARLRFASLHSIAAERVLTRASPGIRPDALPDAILLVDDRGIHTASTAVLRILGSLRPPWPGALVALAIPRVLRDALYRAIARNRLRWFPRAEACPRPSPEIAARFLEMGPEVDSEG